MRPKLPPFLKVRIQAISNYYRVTLGSDDYRDPMTIVGRVFKQRNPFNGVITWGWESDDSIIAGFTHRRMAVKHLVLMHSVIVPEWDHDLGARGNLFFQADAAPDMPSA